jgi:aminopeptidase N
MPTYLASIAASEYVLLEDYYVYAIGETLDVTHYVYPDRVAAAAEDFNVAVPMLQFYSLTFGTYPFNGEKYGVALCNIGGGMEHQTLTSYGYWLVTGDHRYDYIYAHELAHQWFGDLITCKDWTHIWLNEGFASYAEALWFEHLEGPVKLRTYMESKDRPSYWSGPIMRDANNNDPWYYFNQVVYDKAAWVLHMLRHIVGDATFRTTLQSYVADTRFRYSVAETDDFISVCEDFHGAPLDWFFDPWLTRTDRLAYDWHWLSYEQAGDYYLTVMVDQVQQDLYTMPVDFRIVTGAGQIDTTFWVDERHEEYQLVLADSTLSVELDPDHWILCTENRIYTGAEAIPSAAFLDQNYPNPFNPITTIRFGISEPGRVALQIFDVRGALVTTLTDRHFERGIYEITWNGVSARGEPVASGIYFYRLRTAAGVISKKMLLLR